MSSNIIELVSEFLGFTPEVVKSIAKKAPHSYRRYCIPKKKVGAGKRTIFHPSKTTKALQYALMEMVLCDLPIHDCAAAYRRNIKSPLLVNAQKHAHFAYSIRIDFTDFFPSIKPLDLISLIKKIEHFKQLSKVEKVFIQNALFVRYPNNRVALAIGAPSSPLISNAVMYELDEKLTRVSKSISSNSVYTRYADDLVFSTDKKGGCKEFYEECSGLVNQTDSPKLLINKNKTYYSSRKTKRVVTGLFVCPDKTVSIGRKNKRFIRKLLFDFKNNALDKKSEKYLSGYLSYILDVEPDFYNRLVIKYGANLVSSAHKSTKK